MGSAVVIVPPARQDGILEGEMGPYIPSFSVSGASTKEVLCHKVEGTIRPVEVEASKKACYVLASMAARALGEAHFEGTVSADEPTDPPSVFVRMERTQPTELLESTDGPMYPTRVELTETSDRLLSLEETRPLVVTELDAVHDSSGFISNLSDATISTVPVEHAKTRVEICSNSGLCDPTIIIGGEMVRSTP